jgi:hypothetical protein
LALVETAIMSAARSRAAVMLAAGTGACAVLSSPLPAVVIVIGYAGSAWLLTRDSQLGEFLAAWIAATLVCFAAWFTVQPTAWAHFIEHASRHVTIPGVSAGASSDAASIAYGGKLNAFAQLRSGARLLAYFSLMAITAGLACARYRPSRLLVGFYAVMTIGVAVVSQGNVDYVLATTPVLFVVTAVALRGTPAVAAGALMAIVTAITAFPVEKALLRAVSSRSGAQYSEIARRLQHEALPVGPLVAESAFLIPLWSQAPGNWDYCSRVDPRGENTIVVRAAAWDNAPLEWRQEFTPVKRLEPTSRPAFDVALGRVRPLATSVAVDFTTLVLTSHRK